ncbi:MAG: hypothetical protein NWF04_06235 [Candidatus Bathyarchaeota archaeon]|nr:hypothetical protein [Candidatus Bathyarchaeota archaeon]
MSEFEDPTTTLIRLLKSNLQVVKDDGSIADVEVSREWQGSEAFRGCEGQVTIGLFDSLDQKLELSGKTRKRTSTLRVKIWTTEQTGATENSRVLRNKIVEEVNRVLRQNRARPNQTLYSFYGLSPTSESHSAFCGSNEAAPDAQEEWTQLSVQDYQKLWSSDDDRYELSNCVEGQSAAALFGFKLESREKAVKAIALQFEGYGVVPAGSGVVVKAWNSQLGTWVQAQSSGGEEDQTVSVVLSLDLPDFVDDKGYVWLLVQTANVSDGETPAVLSCDYVGCTVTVNGVTYCDVVGYREVDRVDVKPFVFCTEFTVKSWFFENIGE